MNLKGQTASEYLILIAGVVLIAVIMYVVLSQTVFAPQHKVAQNASEKLSNWLEVANTTTLIKLIRLPTSAYLNSNNHGNNKA